MIRIISFSGLIAISAGCVHEWGWGSGLIVFGIGMVIAGIVLYINQP